MKMLTFVPQHSNSVIYQSVQKTEIWRVLNKWKLRHRRQVL